MLTPHRGNHAASLVQNNVFLEFSKFENDKMPLGDDEG
jgi:hypothetical protein